MKVIHKYPLAITGFQIVKLPVLSQILSAQMQRGVLCLWVLVDTEDVAVPLNKSLEIEVVGTGNPMPDVRRSHIGTVQDGAFVWHVFERT